MHGTDGPAPVAPAIWVVQHHSSCRGTCHVYLFPAPPRRQFSILPDSQPAPDSQWTRCEPPSAPVQDTEANAPLPRCRLSRRGRPRSQLQLKVWPPDIQQPRGRRRAGAAGAAKAAVRRRRQPPGGAGRCRCLRGLAAGKPTPQQPCRTAERVLSQGWGAGAVQRPRMLRALGGRREPHAGRGWPCTAHSPCTHTPQCRPAAAEGFRVSASRHGWRSYVPRACPAAPGTGGPRRQRCGAGAAVHVTYADAH